MEHLNNQFVYRFSDFRETSAGHASSDVLVDGTQSRLTVRLLRFNFLITSKTEMRQKIFFNEIFFKIKNIVFNAV